MYMHECESCALIYHRETRRTELGLLLYQAVQVLRAVFSRFVAHVSVEAPTVKHSNAYTYHTSEVGERWWVVRELEWE
jgi:hypothetical protein